MLIKKILFTSGPNILDYLLSSIIYSYSKLTFSNNLVLASEYLDLKEVAVPIS